MRLPDSGLPDIVIAPDLSNLPEGAVALDLESGEEIENTGQLRALRAEQAQDDDDGSGRRRSRPPGSALGTIAQPRVSVVVRAGRPLPQDRADDVPSTDDEAGSDVAAARAVRPGRR